MKKSDVDLMGGNNKFAELIGVSPSRATQIFYKEGGRNGSLTYEQAKKVMDKYPHYALEYLLQEQD